MAQSLQSSSLGDAARGYLDAFPAGDVQAFALTPLDVTGLPVWVVALFPEDARLDGIMPYGVGYGVTDEQAVLGALGEIAEMVWPTLTLAQRSLTRGSWTDLAAGLGADAVADPLTLCLPAGSPVGHATVLDWVAAVRARDGASVLVPLELAAYSKRDLPPGYVPFTTLISNGMGAGPDIDWALGHGLCELLQRDGNGLLFRALDQGVVLDLPDPPPRAASAILEAFGAAGIRVLPKYATDEFGMANLYCVGHETSGQPPTPVMLTACGEACHADRDKALAKALTEFAASRVRKAFAHGPARLGASVAPPGYVERFLRRSGGNAKTGESRAFNAMRAWTRHNAEDLTAYLADSLFSEGSRKAFGTLPNTPAADPRISGRIIRERLRASGFDVLYVDLSPPGANIAVVKVIVPGLEVETMSYYRIGERNTAKLIARDHPLIRFGEPSETLRPVRLTSEAMERLGGQPLFDVALAERIVGPLYPLYREPEAHHVAHSTGAAVP